MSDKLTIVKVGGKIVEEPETLDALLERFAQIDGFKLLVHGGGRSATAMASRLGIESVMINGRRVTDAPMLEVVTMVYGGLVNKKIVAGLQARHINAIGVTGADMDMLRSRRRPITAEGIDYGFVGDVERVNSVALTSLIRAGAVPVIAPLTHDGHGCMLNTNADTMASATACALAGMFDVHLIFCFEKAGVLSNPDDDSSVIPNIRRTDFAPLVDKGIVQGGMIPKIENALASVDAGVAEVIITSHTDMHGGTHILP